MPSATLSYAGRSATLNWADGDSLSQQDVDAAQDHLQNVANADTLANNARYGAGSAVSGLGSAAQVVGDAASNVGLTGTGAALNSAGGAIKSVGQAIAPNDPNFQPTTGGSLVGDVEGGRYGQAAHDVGDLVAQVAPQAGAAYATGGVAAAGLGAASALGNAAQAHAGQGANATVSDALHPDVGVQALGGLAMGRLVGGKVPLNFLGRIGTDAAVNSGTSVATNLANGQAPNWSDALGAGIQGAGSAGVIGARDVVGRGINAATGRAMQAAQPDFTSDFQKQSAIDAQAAMDSHQAAYPNMSDQQVANGAWKGLQGDITSTIRAMPAGQERTDYQTAFQQAKVGKSSLDESLLPDPQSDLARKLGALNALSANSFKQAQVGPLETLAKKGGQLAAPLVGTALGGLDGGFGGMVLHGAAGSIAGRIGRAGDQLFGSQRNPVTLQAANAARALGNNALPPIGSQQAANSPLPQPGPNGMSAIGQAYAQPAVSQPPQAPPAAPNAPQAQRPTPAPAAPTAAPQAPQMGPPPALTGPVPSQVPGADAANAAFMAQPGHPYITSRVPGATHGDVVNAAQQLEMSGAVPQGTTATLHANPQGAVDPTVARQIQAMLFANRTPPGATQSAPGVKGASDSAVAADPVMSPTRYNAKTNLNLARVAQAVNDANAILPGSGNYVQDIGDAHGDVGDNHTDIKTAVAEDRLARLPPATAAKLRPIFMRAAQIGARK